MDVVRPYPREYPGDSNEPQELSDYEYEILFDYQGGKCAACGRTKSTLIIDHDHGTGLVRGLLCQGCNTRIGVYHDDEESLDRDGFERSALYLHRTPTARLGIKAFYPQTGISKH